MELLGNILWLIFGGFELAAGWLISGVLCCLTIIGIPLGLQCFKFATVSLWPFGKEIVYGGGFMSLIANVIWLICCGIPLALAHLTVGIVWCCTIIGIPLGKQCLKLCKLSLMPFGATIV